MQAEASRTAKNAVTALRAQAAALVKAGRDFEAIEAELDRAASRVPFLVRRGSDGRAWWVNASGRARAGRDWPTELVLAGCAACGQPMAGKSVRRRTCSDACKMQAHRAVAAAEEAGAEAPKPKRPVQAIGFVLAPRGKGNPMRHVTIDLPDAMRPEGLDLTPGAHVRVELVSIRPLRERAPGAPAAPGEAVSRPEHETEEGLLAWVRRQPPVLAEVKNRAGRSGFLVWLKREDGDDWFTGGFLCCERESPEEARNDAHMMAGKLYDAGCGRVVLTFERRKPRRGTGKKSGGGA